jgi:D-glycero-alpha-D-manno-heptose 1-phosphate guanylyltransferase
MHQLIPKPLFVLAGGFGTRLRSVVSDVPKPLAPVNGVPFLKHLLLNWKDQGSIDIYLLLHHGAEAVVRFVEEMAYAGELRGLNVRTLVEETPLGTGGSIANALRHFDVHETFLLTNADTWLGSGIRELSVGSPCALGIVQISDASRFGRVITDNGRICTFQEKSLPGAGWINSGLYHLTPEVFRPLAERRVFSLEADLFPHLARAGQLHAVQLETEFIDIGVPEDYRTFCHWSRAGRKNGLA